MLLKRLPWLHSLHARARRIPRRHKSAEPIIRQAVAVAACEERYNSVTDCCCFYKFTFRAAGNCVLHLGFLLYCRLLSKFECPAVSVASRIITNE